MNKIRLMRSNSRHTVTSYSFAFMAMVFVQVFIVGCGENQATSASSSKTSESTAKTDKPSADKIIVFFGNSLTAGYGLKDDESFPSILQDRIDSLELNYKVVNAGLSGETSAGGDRRIEWVLKQPMDIFVLELGGNDMLRGTDPEATIKNLSSIIEKVREKNPNIPIVLAGMIAPPNMGQTYIDAFANIYPTLAKKYDLTLIPFFLEGVAGDPDLNLLDRIHPNAEGQKIVANTVWKYLEPLLDKE